MVSMVAFGIGSLSVVAGCPVPVEAAEEDPLGSTTAAFVVFLLDAPTPAPTAMAMITSRTTAAIMILPLFVRQKGTRA